MTYPVIFYCFAVTVWTFWFSLSVVNGQNHSMIKIFCCILTYIFPFFMRKKCDSMIIYVWLIPVVIAIAFWLKCWQKCNEVCKIQNIDDSSINHLQQTKSINPCKRLDSHTTRTQCSLQPNKKSEFPDGIFFLRKSFLWHFW